MMLHCGANLVSPLDVRSVHTPAPTDTHYPVSHESLIEQVVRVARARSDLGIEDQAHSMSHGGDRYFGMFRMHAPNENDYAPVIGLRNSHDMTFSAGLVMGSSVFVCDNLAFSGEVKLARKHTRNIERDLPRLVDRAFDVLDRVERRQEIRIDAYKDAQLGDLDRSHLLIEAARCGALSWSGLGKVDQEMKCPTHEPEEFGVKWDSAWFAFNCCTEVLKTRSKNGVDPRWTQWLHNIFDQTVGLGDYDPLADLDIEDAEILEAA